MATTHLPVGDNTAFQVSSEDVADCYERYLVPALHRPWAEQLVDLVAPAPGERVVDVGCGTGVAARLAAERVGPSGTVVGVDLNDAMLDVARDLGADVGAEIDWRRADATHLPFDDAAFDAVVCQQSLQFFPDRLGALREMYRVLAPQGRVALSVWRPLTLHPVWAAVDDVVARHLGAETRSPFPEVDAGTWRDLVAAAGFTRVRVRIGIAAARFPEPGEFFRRVAVSSPLAGVVAALDDEAHAALVADLRRGLAEHTDDEGVVFAMQTYLVDARRD